MTATAIRRRVETILAGLDDDTLDVLDDLVNGRQPDPARHERTRRIGRLVAQGITRAEAAYMVDEVPGYENVRSRGPGGAARAELPPFGMSRS